MKSCCKSLYILAILIVGLAVAGSVRAAVLGNDFAYQGKLNFDGDPANGLYDFEFKLYDAEVDGSQVGSNIQHDKVEVVGGYFSAALNFGGSTTIFDGDARWLEISVKPSGPAAEYTVLSPRQPITAVPYALYSKKAGSLQGSGGVVLPTTDYHIELEVNGLQGPENGKFVFHDFDMLESETDVIEYQDGSDLILRKRPGRSYVRDISLTRFVNADRLLYQWMQDTIEGNEFRYEVALTIWNKRGEMIVNRLYYECWPKKLEYDDNKTFNTVEECVVLVSEGEEYLELSSKNITPTVKSAGVLLPIEVQIDGFRDVLECDEFSGLLTELEVVEYQNGDDPILRKRPGRVKYGSCGLIYSGGDDKSLLDWYMTVVDGNYEPKAVAITMSDRRGLELFRVDMVNCWPSAVKVMPGDEGEGADHEIVIETEVISVAQ